MATGNVASLGTAQGANDTTGLDGSERQDLEAKAFTKDLEGFLLIFR